MKKKIFFFFTEFFSIFSFSTEPKIANSKKNSPLFINFRQRFQKVIFTKCLIKIFSSANILNKQNVKWNVDNFYFLSVYKQNNID